MPKWIRWFALPLLALLAGCTTTPWPNSVPPVVEIRPPESMPPQPMVVQPPPTLPSINQPPAQVTNSVSLPIRPVVSRAETWVPLERWGTEHGFGAPKRTAPLPPTFTLSSNKGMLVVAAGSRAARWNGTEIALGFAPHLANNGIVLHALDVEKNLQPLISSAPLPAGTNRVIVIDPGHGGTDAGARSATDGRFEKEFTLDWAKRLQSLLTTMGWTAFLTRSNDANIPLTNRVAFAERVHADLFLSLHFNSAYPSREQSGLETYLLTPAGMPSNLTRGYEDDASLIFPNNLFDAQNLQFAMRLHRALLAVNGSPDRGVRHARFLGVLRGQQRPAVLVEGGYLSNPVEARKIADPKHRQKLAEAVAKALE